MDTEITPTPASGDTYQYGESVECSITFSAGLDVEGSKHLNLRVGADQANNWPGANYREGSGTDIAYQSGPGVTSPVLNNQSGYKVDGSLVTRDDTAPTITAVTFADSHGPGDDSTYGERDWIVVSVRFDEDVEVVYPLPNREPPQIGLIIGDVKRSAQYGVLPGTPQGLSQPQDPQSVLKFGCRRGTLTLTGSQ